MSEEYGLKFVVNGEDYDKIKKSLNEQIEDLQQKVEQLEKENEATLKNYGNLVKEWNQLENIRKEAIEYVTSYESISTIQGLDAIEKNKILDEKTMNEMVNRYLKVHDNLLNILNKGDNNVKDKR